MKHESIKDINQHKNKSAAFVEKQQSRKYST